MSDEETSVREPYRGLMPFTEEDADFFFGRRTEREVIVANLLASRLTILYGASGVGKTSILQAGVLHQLRQRAKKNLARFGTPKFVPVIYRSWSDDPLSSLLDNVKNSILVACDNQSLEITYHSRDLSQVLLDWTKLVNCDLLVILDQFEDYFLYHADTNIEDRFAVELSKAVNLPSLRANFLISLRDDSLSKLDHFKGRIPNLFSNYFRIAHLERRAAIDAIKEPIRQYNLIAKEGRLVDIDPRLVDVVIDHVGVGQITIDEFGGGKLEPSSSKRRSSSQIETSYLQLVMQKLWQEEIGRGSRTLSLSTIGKLNGVEGIVKKHVKDVMSTLSPVQQDIAERVFHYLVTPTGAKIAHNSKDLAASIGGRLAWTDVSELLIELSQQHKRIVRPIPSPNFERLVGGTSGALTESAESEAKLNARYEIFHDILTPAILSWRIGYRKRRDLDNQRKQAIKFGVMAVVISFIIGILVAISSYRWNWFGARVIYLAAKNSDPMDVIDWLVDQQVMGNIVLDDVSNPATQRALVALRFAYELDPKSQKTRNYIERLLRESKIQTRPRTARLELIRNNMKILNEIYGIVPYEPIRSEAANLAIRARRLQDSTDALAILDRIERQIHDVNVCDTTIFNGYYVLLNRYSIYVDSLMVESNLSQLDTLIRLFGKQLVMQESDTVTVYQQLESWRFFIQMHQRNSPERLYAQIEIERLEDVIRVNAAILSDDSFVTCRSVVNLMPQGISSRFSPGNVCAWAKISSPRSERITFKWYAAGSLFHTTAFSIPASSSYRIHAAKRYDQDTQGINEVRVYNNQGLLIGRRTFSVF